MKVLLAVLALFVVCAFAQRKESECEKWRKRAEKNPDEFWPGALIPKCEENGDFAALQCHHDRFCQCWARDGSPLTKPSAEIKHCGCVREKDERLNHLHPIGSHEMIGTYVPSCKSSGHWEPKQCWASIGKCWCVDEVGTKLSEPSRDATNC